jgi:hypothetical protein
METEEPKTKNCSKCGKSFQCLHNKDCWCMDYEISPENLKKLQKTYKDCLCPECLAGYATKKRKS